MFRPIFIFSALIFLSLSACKPKELKCSGEDQSIITDPSLAYSYDMIVSGGGLMAMVSNTNQYQVVSIADIAKEEGNIPIRDIAEFKFSDGKLYCSEECAQIAVDSLNDAANKNLKEQERKDLKRQRFIDSLNSVKKGSN